ncbi:molybdenum cofactor biosynthesis protein MoaE [Devriesea agamarum]|uniref:molybdenum cofactor biosynthesis protein MoaE n=1 Tax=Devriesea agamarum TaxID=472569 RepID=UPI000A8998EB
MTQHDHVSEKGHVGRENKGLAGRENGVAEHDRDTDQDATAEKNHADRSGTQMTDVAVLGHPGDPAFGDIAERIRYTQVTTDEISTMRMASMVIDPRCGAVVTFDGAVRDHDEGRGVVRLVYSAHPSAQEVIEEVAREVATRYPGVILALAHRVGTLSVGETALACAVAAAHRKLAFIACDDLVDTVKKRLPIWKEQAFTDGSSEWVGALE